MGIAKKTDGRYLVGIGVDNANDYRGSAAYRDIYIQLTSSGATEKSEEYLNYLKDYAIHANSLGEPIMPPSVDVWISNHGVTTAVEADDVSIDGNNYTICGIAWNGSSWDYSNAGQGHGGGGGSSLPSYSSADIGKVLTIGEGGETVEPKWKVVPKPEYDAVLEVTYDIGSNTYTADRSFAEEAALDNGVTLIRVLGGLDPWEVLCTREKNILMPGSVVTEVIYTQKNIVLELAGNQVRFDYEKFVYQSTGFTSDAESGYKYINLATD